MMVLFIEQSLPCIRTSSHWPSRWVTLPLTYTPSAKDFPPFNVHKSLYIFRKHLIKTCHVGFRLTLWLLEISLVFIAVYEKSKSLET